MDEVVMGDLRGTLTARTPDVVKEMRFAGQGNIWSGGSVLIAAVRRTGEACLSLHYSTGNFGDKLDHFWAIELSSEQRKALAALLLSYEPVLFESTMASGCTRSHPHENMSAECERLTEVARANNRAAHSAGVSGE